MFYWLYMTILDYLDIRRITWMMAILVFGIQYDDINS